ncbi:MAG: cysteine--tRNA ligase [Candidatus Aenigmatarchaeota archaeon]
MLKVHNTLTKKDEEFRPMKGKEVKMFVCGPTVYDYTHIGHAKSYVAFDVIAKYLRYRGFKVFYLQNITDVEDRLIIRSKESGRSVADLVKEFTKKYYEDMEALGVDSIDKYAPATEYMKQIIEQVKGLIEKGFAYEISDGVYYDVSKFPEYGKLSHLKKEAIKKHRIEPNPEKRNPEDFVLWKKHKPGEPAWDSPWGKGRPGWHIEDTAITIHHFGSQYDLHGGGEDLIFPHHDCEIAQAEAFTGVKPFVRYWLHNAFILVEGQKMSKSLGNFYTVRDIFAKGYEPIVVRFSLLNTNYNKPANFTFSALESGKDGIDRLREFMRKVKEAKGEEAGIEKLIEETREKFENAMDDNFNTPNAIAAIFNFVRDVNKLVDEGKVSQEEGKKIIGLMEKFDSVLGILKGWEKEEKIPEDISKLLEEREEARKKKDFKLADDIRNKIKDKGWIVEDTPSGPRVRKA